MGGRERADGERKRAEREKERLRREEQEHQDALQLGQLNQQILDLRKKNVQLEALTEEARNIPKQDPAAEAELQHLRREIQDMRREKVRMEVELDTRKSADEYDA